MEKKVMSFDEFVFEAYKMIQEGQSSFEDIKALMRSLFNFKERGEKALVAIEHIAKMNSSNSTELLESITSNLYEIFNKLDTKDNTKVDRIKIEIGPITFEPVIGGNIFTPSDLKDIKSSEFFNKGEKSNLVDFLGSINEINIKLKNKILDSTFDEKNKWKKDKGYIRGTGLDNQYIISQASPSLEVSKIELTESPKFLAKVSGEINPGVAKKREKTLSFVLAQYIIQGVKPGSGRKITDQDIPQTKIKRSEGSGDFQSIEIIDDKTLFDQNSPDLKKNGEKNILLAIKSIFNSVNSIEIIGGASKEGPKNRNEELCKLRAKAVENYLKTIVEDGVKIIVSDKFDIQPQDSQDSLKKWRKVTLNIKGTKLIPDTGTKQETTTYNASDKLSADKVTVAQILMEYQVSLR